MPEEFIMRGQTATTAGLNTEVLNFSGYKPGYAYRLVELQIYPSTGIGSNNDELTASITAGKTAIDPTVPNFNEQGLIGTAILFLGSGAGDPPLQHTIVNDRFLITQNLILMVQNTNAGTPVNWQCRFVKERMNGPETAAANYKQYLISDGS
jgi:hypothetical protein